MSACEKSSRKFSNWLVFDHDTSTSAKRQIDELMPPTATIPVKSDELVMVDEKKRRRGCDESERTGTRVGSSLVTRKKLRTSVETDNNELTRSPVSGTYILKDWDGGRVNKRETMSLVMNFTKTEVALNSIAASFVEITPQARARLERIPNRIGPFECKLCKVIYADAFALAMHNCPRVVHIEYRCSECGKIFNCPANLASHKRWHKPRQTPCEGGNISTAITSVKTHQNHSKHVTRSRNDQLKSAKNPTEFPSSLQNLASNSSGQETRDECHGLASFREPQSQSTQPHQNSNSIQSHLSPFSSVYYHPYLLQQFGLAQNSLVDAPYLPINSFNDLGRFTLSSDHLNHQQELFSRIYFDYFKLVTGNIASRLPLPP